jgi:hypothetical protein
MAGKSSWAVITGASSGIGRALALEFASGGSNVFLSGRNQAALDQVARECSRAHHVETETLAADLAAADGADILIARLASLPYRFDVVVNNAGFGIHGDFASTAIESNVDLVQVQLTAALKLTRALLPAMISRRHGRILNVASVYSFSPVPFQSVYGASKAFLLSFSSALRNELKGTGVTVTVFCPGTTQTAFRTRAGIGEKHANPGATAAEAAAIAYRATMAGRHLVVPGLVNRAFVLATRHLPASLVPGVVRFINRRRGQSHS